MSRDTLGNNSYEKRLREREKERKNRRETLERRDGGCWRGEGESSHYQRKISSKEATLMNERRALGLEGWEAGCSGTFQKVINQDLIISLLAGNHLQAISVLHLEQTNISQWNIDDRY